MARDPNMKASILLVEEYFSSQDDRFLVQLREVTVARLLAPFATQWAKDPRPWAREQQLAYLALPMNVPGHQPVVKRLFKQAVEKGDDELVAVCQVAFDRLIRRQRRKRYHYDRQTGQSTQVEVLHTPQNTLPNETGPRYYRSDSERLYSNRTRYYLRRAAWRYFRRLGFQKPDAYCAAIAQALRRYEDRDVEKGEHLLDCWGLMQACYRKHGALDFQERRIVQNAGRRLTELTATPKFEKLWLAPAAAPVLLVLVTRAQARLVRTWAMEMLLRHGRDSLESIGVGAIVALLDSSDAEVQRFAVSLLERSPHLATQPLDFWLRLLEVRDPTTLATICQLVERHVTRDRMTLEQCVRLATAKAAPVARLGLMFLKQTTIASAVERGLIARLALAQCAALGGEIAAWALGIVGKQSVYDREAVSGFFDSNLLPMRTAAWDWLLQNETPAHDAALFARLTETSHDDLRLKLIEELHRRTTLPGTNSQSLKVLWASVLLGVQRGGRQKLQATRQLAEAIVENPVLVHDLLPVLAVAVRSIRPAEMRAGLVAVLHVIDARPELAKEIAAQLPELALAAEVA
jgi:hypothetical protein